MAKVKAEQKTWGYIKKKGERLYAPSMIFNTEPSARYL